MKLESIALVTIIGFATPAVAAIQNFDYPSGYYRDNTWAVQLRFNEGEYNFQRIHLQTNQSIFSTDVTKSGDKNRQVYTWKKDGYSYKVSYRPKQPNIIRLEIYHPNGQPILNRLLYSNR
ncbi:hypothetical protein DSM106972_038610 [Dulcicalothrix desertica PCC 7102]|uniref:Uncharacterized protein n=1 Tax=Dulcicalothrix desertica PCC 7102 TaxID=232991 RepID=A0A3S1IZI4_9CYAN|nr:hypothetical protein [Dulcicalothrix desertica]RUT05040.1 hypothetical protein DSM106972_038610 [Dulcicalothrix desertica PCC 7102]TWH62581.1 hypothetical protein CAL7102_00074 [Dulcicalothrix desertica PCC 7102]